MIKKPTPKKTKMSSFAPQNACQNTWTKKLQACSVNTHHLTVEDLPILTEEGKSMSVFNVSAESSPLGVSGPFPVLQLQRVNFESSTLDVEAVDTPSGVSVRIDAINGVYEPNIELSEGSITDGPITAIWELRGSVMTLAGHFSMIYPDSGRSIELTLPLPPGYTTLEFTPGTEPPHTTQLIGNGDRSVSTHSTTFVQSSADYIVIEAYTTDQLNFQADQSGKINFFLSFLARSL